MSRFTILQCLLLLQLVNVPDAVGVPATIAQLKRELACNSALTNFEFSATITLRQKFRASTIVLQDGDDAIALWNHTKVASDVLLPGTRVHVYGSVKRHPDGTVFANCRSLKVLSKGRLPQPRDISLDELEDSTLNARLVRLRGKVIDVFQDDLDNEWTYLSLDCDGALVILVNDTGPKDRPELERLIGATVAVTGVLEYRPPIARREIKASVHIFSRDSIEVLDRPAVTDPFSAEDVGALNFLGRRDLSSFVKRSATGHVIAVWGENKILLRTDQGALVKGELACSAPPAYGDHVRISGFPETDLYTAILTRAIWKPSAPGSPFPDQKPTRVSVSDLQVDDPNGRMYKPSHHGQAICLQGIIKGLPSSGGNGCLYVEVDNQMTLVDASSVPMSLSGLQLGSTIQVCGTCVMETEKMGMSRAFPRITGFRTVIRSPDDIRVLANPPWWTILRLITLSGTLAIILAGIFAWNVSLRKQVLKRSDDLVQEKIRHIASEAKVGERTRLSIELHDSLSQNLIGTALEVNAVEQLIVKDPLEALRHLDIVSKTLKSCRNELHNCLWDLRCQALEEATMDGAIRKTIEPYIDGVTLSIRFNVTRTLLSDNIAHALMRIIRELVLNAIRHGHASTIKIAGSQEDKLLRFSVRDNGCGFNPLAAPGIQQGHFGLHGVSERLRLLKGKMEITSSSGVGSNVRISIPFENIHKALPVL